MMEADEASSLLAEQKETITPVEPKDPGEPSEKCKVYRSRWYVLFVFTLISIVSNLMWNTWGPIQRSCRLVFKWDRWTILLLSSLGAIGPILSAFPSSWMMDTKGLRFSAQVTSMMLLVGKALQLIPIKDLVSKTVFIYIGHLITMLPSFVANGAPPVVSSTWFPPNERTTATAIATLAANFGIALSFIIGPQMISMDKVGNLTYADAVDGSNLAKIIGGIEGDIMNYFYVQTGVAALLVVCVLVYLPDKPPLPPSVAALTRASTKISYLEGSKMVLTNKSYWLLATVFALSFGIYFAWTSVLDIAVQPFGIGETFSGWLGTGTSLAGIISGIFIARSADIMKHWTKTILISLYTGTVIWQLLFAFSCSRILPFSKALLLVSVTCIGLLFNGTIPLVFELIMEHVFPIGEGTSLGIVLILGNAVILLFDVTFMFPMSDVRWMNWVFVGGIGLCIPLLFLYKTQYRRLDLDTD